MKGAIRLWDWITNSADKLDKASTFLTDYEKYLQFQDIFGWIGNKFAWGYIRFIYFLNEGLEKLLVRSFDVGDFLKSQGLTDLESSFVKTLGAVLLLCTAVIIGIKMMVGKNPPKLKESLFNLVIAVFLLFFSSSIINDLYNVSKQGFMDVTQIKGDSPAMQLVQDNTSDLTIVLEKGIKGVKEGDKLTAITKKNFKHTDMSSVITPDDISDIKKGTKNDDAQYLEYVFDIDNKGNLVPVTYKDNFISKKFAPSGYRRYAANKGIIAVGETSLVLGYTFIIFSIIMCIFELGYKKFYLLIATATDLDTGQRRNKALESVSKSLLLIAFTGLELNIYLKIIAFLGDSELNPLIYIIGMLSATLLLFKGSQSVSELFGVDTSLKNGAGSLMAAFAAMSIAKSAMKGRGKNASESKKGLNNIRNNDSDPDTNDSEQEKEENEHIPSAPKTSLGEKAANLAKKAGKATGYMSERKIGGAIQDGADKAKGGIKEGVGQVLDKAKDTATKPIKEAKDFADTVKSGFEDGVVDGLTEGAKNNNKNVPKDTPSEPTNVPNTRMEDNKTPASHKQVAQVPKREETSVLGDGTEVSLPKTKETISKTIEGQSSTAPNNSKIDAPTNENQTASVTNKKTVEYTVTTDVQKNVKHVEKEATTVQATEKANQLREQQNQLKNELRGRD